MAANADDLVAKVRRVRGVTLPQTHEKLGGKSVQDTLCAIRTFLQEHETPSSGDYTHTVVEHFSDWWVSHKPTYRLAIAEDGALDILQRHIGTCFQLGIPLTIAERRSDEIKFVQDVEIKGTEENTIDVKEITSPDSPFMKFLAECMFEVYPNRLRAAEKQFLDVFAFDTTGKSLKGLKTTYVRFVWAGITVNKERATRISDFIAYKFNEHLKADPTSPLGALLTKLLDFHKDNHCQNIFGCDIYTSKEGMRMPLNDIVSKPPMMKPQMRPFTPLCVLRAVKKESGMEVTSVLENSSLEDREWVKLGSIRQPQRSPLTEWEQPMVKADRATVLRQARQPVTPGGSSSSSNSENRNENRTFLGGRTSGRVAVKTHTGSDPIRRQRPPRSANGTTLETIAEDTVQNIEREFCGTKEEFREKLSEKAGKEGWFEEEHQITWFMERRGDDVAKPTGGKIEAKIVFQEGPRKVWVTGKKNQCRHLLQMLGGFCKGIGESAASVSQANTRSRAGYAGSVVESRHRVAPSAVYQKAPSSAGGHSIGRSSAFSTSSLASNGFKELVPYRRMVTVAQEAETADEVSLNYGDIVTVENDNMVDGCDKNRWVYVLNERTNERGWMPLSYAQRRVDDEPSVEVESTDLASNVAEGSVVTDTTVN